VNPDQAYQELLRLSREETVLSSCLDFLEWDEEVCMPGGGVQHRAEQTALLAGLVHDHGTDPRYDERPHARAVAERWGTRRGHWRTKGRSTSG